MGENDNESKSGIGSTLFKEGLKAAWKKLPPAVKIKIIGIAGAVLLGLIIIIAIIGAFSPSALDYSDRAVTAKDEAALKEDFEDIWYELCEEDECDEDLKKFQEELIKSQKKFYNQLDRMVSRYKLNKKQRYTLLTTIFLDYSIDEFYEGNAFDIVETSSEEDNQNENKPKDIIYEKEKDTIKKLAREFEPNESENESYYNFLKSKDFLDNRENLKSYYINYASSVGKDVSNLTEDDKISVRLIIIENIKDIVADYMGEINKDYKEITANGTGYWWPIGSAETTEQDGKLFAIGEPTNTYISSYYGLRIHPTENVPKKHNGIDIPGNLNTAYVIAAIGGEVKKIYNSCVSYGELYCGGGYGNYIMILDALGNTTVYAHLHQGSITVNIGDIVSRGQVIGKVGSSGNSTGSHLHFGITVNGDWANPLDYVDPKNPRPTVSNEDFDFNHSVYSEAEFIAVVNEYYSQDGACSHSYPAFTTRCNKLKDDILNGDGARIIYNIATERNINPEIIFPRMMLEGYASGNGHNYFSYGCGNTSSSYSCEHGFSSFEEGITAFFDNASKYDSLFSFMSQYAHLGDYWYNVEAVNAACYNEETNSYECGPSGVGGCYYVNYMYPDGAPAHVIEACSHTTCSHKNTTDCVATADSDRDDYTRYQVRMMTSVRKKFFK